MQTGDWFGVRCWFLFESGALDSERGQVYEERVTIWRAATLDDARERATAEADAYPTGLGPCVSTTSRRTECTTSQAPALRTAMRLEDLLVLDTTRGLM